MAMAMFWPPGVLAQNHITNKARPMFSAPEAAENLRQPLRFTGHGSHSVLDESRGATDGLRQLEICRVSKKSYKSETHGVPQCCFDLFCS